MSPSFQRLPNASHPAKPAARAPLSARICATCARLQHWIDGHMHQPRPHRRQRHQAGRRASWAARSPRARPLGKTQARKRMPAICADRVCSSSRHRLSSRRDRSSATASRCATRGQVRPAAAERDRASTMDCLSYSLAGPLPHSPLQANEKYSQGVRRCSVQLRWVRSQVENDSPRGPPPTCWASSAERAAAFTRRHAVVRRACQSSIRWR